jgi:DNA-binding NtrC family response regulator
MPQLAERMEDIPILAKYFLEEANSEFHKEVKGFSPEAMRCILNHDWPGNIREFKNVARRAVLLAESDMIELDHLSINPRLPTNEAIGAAKPPGKGASFEEITRNFQKDVIKKALKEAEGKKTKAAELLKLNKKTLYRKLKSLNI